MLLQGLPIHTPLSCGLVKASLIAAVSRKFRLMFLGGIGLMNHLTNAGAASARGIQGHRATVDAVTTKAPDTRSRGRTVPPADQPSTRESRPPLRTPAPCRISRPVPRDAC